MILMMMMMMMMMNAFYQASNTSFLYSNRCCQIVILIVFQTLIKRCSIRDDPTVMFVALVLLWKADLILGTLFSFSWGKSSKFHAGRT